MISIFHVFFQRTSHLNFVCFFSLKIIDADLQSGVLAQPLCHSRSVSTSTVRLAQPLHGFNVEFFFGQVIWCHEARAKEVQVEVT